MKQPYQYQISLEAARVNAGLSLKEAAKALRMPMDRLEQYEKDSSRVTTVMARKICLLYCISADLIFWGDASACHERNRHAMKERLTSALIGR